MTQRKKTIIALLLALYGGTAHATALTDTLFVNQSVSGNVTVSVNGNIYAQSDTVTTTGNLTLIGQESVTLNNNVEVQLGGVLIIRTGIPPRIIYTYDASGNRIRREKETQ